MFKNVTFETNELLCYPERSILYQLEPLKIGTPYCESLTSYIQRLAEAHSISLSSLLKDCIAPTINLDYILGDSRRGCSRFLERANAINSKDAMSSYCINALGSLTKLSNLSLLTLQRWGDLLVSKPLCRSNKQWCSSCLAEMAEQNQPIYEPLLWSISHINVCPIHEVFLDDICPHCNNHPPLLSNNSYVGFCSLCGQWLGMKRNTVVKRCSVKQLWISKSIGELISDINFSPRHGSRENIKHSFQRLCSQLADGNVEALSKVLFIPQSTLFGYCCGKYVPVLDTLLNICYSGNVSLVDFILGRPFIYCRSRIPPTVQLKKRAEIEWKYIERKLEYMTSISPPPSLNSVSTCLRITTKTLKRRFPDLYHLLKQNYRDYVSERSSDRRTTIMTKVRDSTFDLFFQGITPTAKTIEKKIGKKGLLREKFASQAWKETKKIIYGCED
ncbi:TniQ family protein [Paenibacillus beijingensis]|uniref:TniQ family protein n=1 Tax=Paenibacillus beijingensis TaxID=1126833 RepID=UPI0009E1D705|nr:TniQ family protein [Paenibacillus beijingensis]